MAMFRFSQTLKPIFLYIKSIVSLRQRCSGCNGRVVSRREEINKAYKRLAVILHPDKNVAPGSEDAFKMLVNARTALLRNK